MDNKNNSKVEISDNDNIIEKQDNNKNSDKNKQNKKRNTNKFIGTLKYGIAALSLVSFITTSEGLKEIVKGNRFVPFLISFGIQMIVLIVGTQLVNIFKSIKKVKVSKEFWRGVIAVSVIVPYLSAVCFSSFFSYVSLANDAYENVKESDYNIEIENFFNEEIMNVKNLNDAAGNITLKQIQSYVPQLKGILDEFSSKYGGDIAADKVQIEKNNTSSLNSSEIYNPETYIYSLSANQEQATRLRGYVTVFDNAANTYNDYYKSYERQYDIIQKSDDKELISSSIKNIEEIERNIQSIDDQISILNNVNDPNSEYDSALKTPISQFTSAFENLKNSFGILKNFYDGLSNENVQNSNLNFNNVYNTIYSTINVDDEKVSDAINDLKSIINAYINTYDMDDIDNDILSNLSNCITYLGEFEKYKNLDQKINDFESNVLQKVYVIEYETTTEKSNEDVVKSDSLTEKSKETNSTDVLQSTTQISSDEIVTKEIENDSNYSLSRISKSEWNQIRRENLGEFIDIVKSLPDFDIILNFYDESLQLKSYADKLEKNKDYKMDTLEKAYSLNRQNLEGISEIERAWNFLSSDFKYMAVYCGFIALFLDLSSLFVGIFIFFYEKSKKKKLSN